VENVTAANRFWAITLGQLFGVLQLFAVVTLAFTAYGQLPDQTLRNEINLGLKMIKITGGVALVALLLGSGYLLYLYKQSGEFKHEHIDLLLWAFVVIDLLCLLFVVCQQGGLSRSMALPVFFLIPAAYLAVVNPSRINTTYYLLAFIAVCVVISFLVSYFGVTKLPILAIKVTDLSTLYPTGHNWALLIVCVMALLIPALQIWKLR